MIICKQISSLQSHLARIVSTQLSIGFVPTMGALHEGHISLIRESKLNTSVTVCSIFVNPTQFNDSKDFEQYPKTIEQDILLLEEAGCNFLFLPTTNEIYNTNYFTERSYDLGYLETVFEGTYRPGHFKGVCQVVDRLLTIVQPTILFLGQKDYQQCMVLKKLISTYYASKPIGLCIVSTKREESGLAMSSRNMRLSKKGLLKAGTIFKSLSSIKEKYQYTPFENLLTIEKQNLLNAGFEKIDYLNIVIANTLEEALTYNASEKYIVLVAAFIEGIRLIDNIALN
jgi:pantoate--beta-alanine ligase